MTHMQYRHAMAKVEGDQRLVKDDLKLLAPQIEDALAKVRELLSLQTVLMGRDCDLDQQRNDLLDMRDAGLEPDELIDIRLTKALKPDQLVSSIYQLRQASYWLLGLREARDIVGSLVGDPARISQFERDGLSFERKIAKVYEEGLREFFDFDILP